MRTVTIDRWSDLMIIVNEKKPFTTFYRKENREFRNFFFNPSTSSYVQGVLKAPYGQDFTRAQKNNPAFGKTRRDSVSMPRRRKGKVQSGNGGAAEKGHGNTVCALCGRTIKQG